MRIDSRIPSKLEPATFNPDAFPLPNRQARSLLHHLSKLANRRPIPESSLHSAYASLQGLSGNELLDATKREIKAILVSPSFLYRGLLLEGEAGKQQRVDAFELAERLSYFLWEDMPDAELMAAAENGNLFNRDGLATQIDRMLASPKALNLSKSFGHQWLGLADIDSAADDATTRGSLRSQPIDFLHYLFTEDRPVMELIDSNVTFASYLTARFYPGDRDQLAKYVKPKGIERQFVPNERIQLEKAAERGGILTMPGILAMNRNWKIDRRSFLRGTAGALLPLPFLNLMEARNSIFACRHSWPLSPSTGMTCSYSTIWATSDSRPTPTPHVASFRAITKT